MGSEDEDERHARIDILKKVRLAGILNERMCIDSVQVLGAQGFR